MSLKEKINAALRRTTGYSLTRETPAERNRVITAAAAEQAERERRTAADDRKRAAEERKQRREAERAARRASGADMPHHFDAVKRETIVRVRDWTMTEQGKLNALIEAVRYVTRHGIPGDIVECGVWRGGSMQAAGLILSSLGDESRELHLFDTFEGMPPPTEEDGRTRDGAFVSADELLATHDRDSFMWAAAGLDLVKEGMAGIDYPQDKIHYHVGMVEDTTPQEAPEQIAILRLDTDWYASTKHEMEHLYPRLAPGGVLIIDDYHAWDGAQKAIDEWLDETGVPLFLAPMSGGRIAVKPFE